MPQGKGTYGSKVGRPPKTKKKGSLLNDDRESYILGGIASKFANRIKNYFFKKSESRLDLKELIEEYDKLTPEQRNKKFNTVDPETGEWNVTRIKDKDFDSFMVNELYLDDTEIAFVLRKYPDFQGETAADVYKHTQSEKFVDDMYLNNRAVAENLDETRWAMDEEYDQHLKEQGVLPEDEFSKGGRVQKQEGGTTEDQMNALAISVAPARVEEQETHTMPDGTEMAGATHGEYQEQMEGLMDKETSMLPDEEMEEDYVDYVMEETLSNEDRNYLIDTLEKDDRLSEIFDQVVESATEFSGSGPIEGPGSEKSDSIPARLSDGEFVFTAKATEEIGSDNLMSMMNEAEAAAEQRQGVAYGGMIDEEDGAIPIQTRGSLAALGRIPNVVKQSRQVEEEMLKSSPRRYYVPVSG